jgi:hypothetical protein
MLFRYEQDTGALSHLHENCANFRMSLYAYEMQWHSYNPQPKTSSLQNRYCKSLATPLLWPREKIEFFPIRCDNLNIQDVVGTDEQISHFPCE